MIVADETLVRRAASTAIIAALAVLAVSATGITSAQLEALAGERPEGLRHARGSVLEPELSAITPSREAPDPDTHMTLSPSWGMCPPFVPYDVCAVELRCEVIEAARVSGLRQAGGETSSRPRACSALRGRVRDERARGAMPR